MCVSLASPNCVQDGNHVGSTITVRPSKIPTVKPSPRSTDIPLICQFGGYCGRSSDCYAGNFCNFGIYPYYTQCLPDPSTYRTSDCLSNYGASPCYSSSQCCDPGAYCDSSTRQCHQPYINSGQCRNPQEFALSTKLPTSVPSVNSANTKTSIPSRNPTFRPSTKSSIRPTSKLTSFPTHSNPSKIPSETPIVSPTIFPSKQIISRTKVPSKFPSKLPTILLSSGPTVIRSDSPTLSPTILPSNRLSKAPTGRPTKVYSKLPTNSPTKSPKDRTFSIPTMEPSLSPSLVPLQLRITISQSSGTSVAVAELEFYRLGMRVDPNLFHFDASSSFGNITDASIAIQKQSMFYMRRYAYWPSNRLDLGHLWRSSARQ